MVSSLSHTGGGELLIWGGFMGLVLGWVFFSLVLLKVTHRGYSTFKAQTGCCKVIMQVWRHYQIIHKAGGL